MADLDRLRTALAGRYRIERVLGVGGMATVYLAHDPKHDRPVAIKVLRPEIALSLGTERFLREIRVTANLQQPHILPLFDSGEVESFVFYVMPFVRGESLRDRLRRTFTTGDRAHLTARLRSAQDPARLGRRLQSTGCSTCRRSWLRAVWPTGRIADRKTAL